MAALPTLNSYPDSSQKKRICESVGNIEHHSKTESFDEP